MSRLVRPLMPGEVATLVGWAAAEGWNPGIADAEAFHAADPDGFLGAFVDGEMVAGISAVAYGTDFGFIGLYICRPDMRGQGHGKAVWDAGMARLDGRTIGLDGVPEQQANYASMGFVRAYETVRMSGIPAPSAADGVTPVPVEMLPEIAAFDRRCFPRPRDEFLSVWLAPPHIALAQIEDGRVRGYGVLRRCVEGHKVGPLFADTTEVAGRLLSALARHATGPIQIDVPATQDAFIALLGDAGLQPGFSTARMYRGRPPRIDASAVFGVTSLELG